MTVPHRALKHSFPCHSGQRHDFCHVHPERANLHFAPSMLPLVLLCKVDLKPVQQNDSQEFRPLCSLMGFEVVDAGESEGETYSSFKKRL